MEWQIDLFRLTAFFPSHAPLRTQGRASELWQTLYGGMPENVVAQSKEGVDHAEGATVLGGANVRSAVMLTPLRVDFIVAPAELQSPRFSLIGSQSEMLEPMIEKAYQFAELLNAPAIRWGHGCGYIAKTDTTALAYETLAQLIPNLNIDFGTMSEFGLQLTRHRMSNVINGLRINRHLKWSAVIMVVGDDTSDKGVRVDSDLNTAADNTEFLAPTEDVLRELFDGAKGVSYEWV